MKTIDLNCDMGESYGRWTLGDDAALMGFLTSANIACGFHGGDPHVMRSTVALAVERGQGGGLLLPAAFPSGIAHGAEARPSAKVGAAVWKALEAAPRVRVIVAHCASFGTPRNRK